MRGSFAFVHISILLASAYGTNVNKMLIDGDLCLKHIELQKMREYNCDVIVNVL